MEEKIKWAANVLLVDVALLNETVNSLRRMLQERLGHSIPSLDLPAWLSYLALDAGLKEGDNEVQVVLIHDGQVRALEGCEPADLRSLQGMACRTPLGEFAFHCVTPEGIVSVEELFLDLVTLALDSAGAQCLALLPAPMRYDDKLKEVLQKFSEEKGAEESNRVIWFGLAPVCDGAALCRHDSVFYSLAQAWGIRSDQL